MVDEQRPDDGPRPERGDDEDFEDAEDPSEHGVVDAALNEGETGDVEDSVACSDDREADYCPGRMRPETYERDRNSPHHQPGGERPREPPQADEGQPGHAPEQPTGSEGRVQEAHARLAYVQQTKGSHDEEDIEQPADECLRSEQPDNQPRVRLTLKRAQTGAQIRDG